MCMYYLGLILPIKTFQVIVSVEKFYFFDELVIVPGTKQTWVHPQ